MFWQAVVSTSFSVPIHQPQSFRYNRLWCPEITGDKRWRLPLSAERLQPDTTPFTVNNRYRDRAETHVTGKGAIVEVNRTFDKFHQFRGCGMRVDVDIYNPFPEKEVYK